MAALVTPVSNNPFATAAAAAVATADPNNILGAVREGDLLAITREGSATEVMLAPVSYVSESTVRAINNRIGLDLAFWRDTGVQSCKRTTNRASARPATEEEKQCYDAGLSLRFAPVAGGTISAPEPFATPRLEWRCISLWNPWAVLMSLGEKKCETRPRPWRYDGPLLIHATRSASVPEEERELVDMYPFRDALTAHSIERDWDALPHGAIVAAGRFTDCLQTERFNDFQVRQGGRTAPCERDFGNYQPGRFFMPFDLACRLTAPVCCSGSQSLWAPSVETMLAVEAQMPEEAFAKLAQPSAGRLL